jgi:long-chain acyl-CoA synthetase
MTSLYEFIINKCETNRLNTLFVFDGFEVSYADYAKDLKLALHFFDNKYLTKRQHNFSIIAPNCYAYLYSLFPLLHRGNRAVNLNPNLGVREITERLNIGDVSVLITTQYLYESLEPCFAETGIETVILIDDLSISFKTPKVIERKSIKNFKRLPHNSSSFFQFTGGTSGVIKAAMLSGENILQNIFQLDSHFGKYIDLNNLVVLAAFPFYHIFALVFNVLFFLSNGGKIVIYKDLRDTALIIDLLEKSQVNFTVGVNTWYKKLMQHPSFKRLDLSGLRACIAGGEYVPVSTKKEWLDLTGNLLSSGYGLTETSSLSIISPLDPEKNIIDSIGKPIENTLAGLLDENDRWIEGFEQAGELVLKGPQVFTGYYNNREETTNAFYQDWFRTGDIAQRVAPDQYKIVDRKKDMISVSGNKVYPNEVEAVIVDIDGVLDAAVVGRPSQKSGEEVVAFVSLDPRTQLTEEEIVVSCKNQLARFKVPKEVFFLDELPKTPIGKTARKVLREQLKIEYGDR